MDAQKFLAEFGHIANAPGGVTRLREMVLALAVSGRLIERPKSKEILATDFLRKLEQELADYKAINKYRRTSEDRDATSTLKVSAPAGWTNARLGQIGVLIRGVTYNKSVASASNGQGMTGLLRANNIGANVSFDDLVYVPSDLVHKEQILRAGDVLIAMSSGSKDLVGKAAIVLEDCEFGFGAFCGAFRPMLSLRREFIRLVMQSPQYRDYVSDQGKGIGINNLTKGHIEDYEFFLPPPEEQSSIVAKVDELMALCDTLETQQQARRKLQNNLRQSTLQAVASANSLYELQVSWKRLEANFETLFSDPGDLEEFRKFILSLAVRGKLSSFSETPTYGTLASILAEASVNGVSKGPTLDTTETEVLKISAGTSRADFNVDEDDFKHVSLSAEEVKKFRLMPGDLLACRYNGNLHYVGRFSYYRGQVGRTQVNPDKLIRFRIASQHDSRYVCLVMNAGPTRQAIEAMCATTAGNIGLSAGRLKTIEIPLLSLLEQRRIVERVTELMIICGNFEMKLLEAKKLAESLAAASIAAFTGIAIEQEEEPMKAPQTELVAPLRLGTAPGLKDQALLATILARHSGEMNAKDLWQRFGGEIDAFYAQLKTEVAYGWILEPTVAEMHEKFADAVSA